MAPPWIPKNQRARTTRAELPASIGAIPSRFEIDRPIGTNRLGVPSGLCHLSIMRRQGSHRRRSGSNGSLVVLAASALYFAGCTPTILSHGPFTELKIHEAQTGEHRGIRVRWGGRIIETVPEAEQTCIEVVGYQLDGAARPRSGDTTLGRFVACASGFYDPAVYSEDREVTVVGHIEGVRSGMIGDFEYHYPLLQAETVYLWPHSEPPAPVYYSPWISPLWYPMWGPQYRYYGAPPPRPPRVRSRPPARPLAPRR